MIDPKVTQLGHDVAQGIEERRPEVSERTVETNAQVAQTLTAQPPSCSDGFAQVWTREDPVVAAGSTGVHVISRTHHFWGCAGNINTFTNGMYHLHLAYAPLP